MRDTWDGDFVCCSWMLDVRKIRAQIMLGFRSRSSHTYLIEFL